MSFRSGESGSSSSAWSVSRTGPGVADRRLSPPRVRAEVIRLACERPADSQVPLGRWSSAELAREAVTRGICEHISGVTVWRWLSQARSSRGSIAPGSSPAIPSSLPRPAASSTYTPGAGKVSYCIPVTTSSAAMRSPRSKPGTASTQRCPPPTASSADSESSTSTNEKVHCATSLPGTRDARSCLTAAPRKTGSSRSTSSSSSS
jgi:hypothetical protein